MKFILYEQYVGKDGETTRKTSIHQWQPNYCDCWVKTTYLWLHMLVDDVIIYDALHSPIFHLFLIKTKQRVNCGA